ncbi:acid-sensing ion channel 2-like isoform X2 [Oculina patagonica]
MNSRAGEEGVEMEPKMSEIGLNEACKSCTVDIERSEVASQVPDKSAATTERWSVFVGSSTLHGLNYMFSSRSLVRRILWALFLVTAMAWFSFESFKLLRKYFSYPVTTKVALEYEGTLEFPAVTICNFNMFNKSVVTAKGYNELLRQFERKLFGLNNENDTMDFNKYNDFNLTEFHFIAGHQISSTLSICVWSGQSCDYRNFTPVLTDMGLCHTFNSGKDGEQILKVKQAGSAFGLQLTLNVHQKEYFGVMSHSAGVKILIHRQGTLPLVSQLGFAVGPGTTTFAAVRKQRVLNLPKPYESNCSNETVSAIPGYPKYTISSCMFICNGKYVIDKCGCREYDMPENFKVLKDFQCDCPVPCDTTSFKPVLSYAAFPSQNYISSLTKTFLLDATNITSDIIKQTEDDFRQNLLELDVYFEELSYTVIQETPAYDSESMLGEIGGQVGLCVGASLLTVLEFCDVIFDLIKIRLGFR